jgi:hypothetical protein
VPNRLDENVLIDAIEEISTAYAEQHGRHPVNVSHWDPSDEFIRNLRAAKPIPKHYDLIRYHYSYMVEERRSVLTKLGITSDSVAPFFTENGSMSILAVANFLSALSVKTVHVLSPNYFITMYSLEKFGLRALEVPHRDIRENVHWPARLGIKSGDALWLTNPIYNTGSYAIEAQCEEILHLAQSGVRVILDETLAITPTVLAERIIGHRNALGIYTPHKSICLNRLKFSVVAFHADYEDFFDDWGDVLFGGLSASATAAISHFVSSEFDSYRSAFLTQVERARSWHENLVASYKDGIKTDERTRGHFISVYFPGIDAELGTSLPFLKNTIDACGAAFIPGNRSGFDLTLGLCFRINLAQDSAQFRGAIRRLYMHLVS